MNTLHGNELFQAHVHELGRARRNVTPCVWLEQAYLLAKVAEKRPVIGRREDFIRKRCLETLAQWDLEKLVGHTRCFRFPRSINHAVLSRVGERGAQEMPDRRDFALTPWGSLHQKGRHRRKTSGNHQMAPEVFPWEELAPGL